MTEDPYATASALIGNCSCGGRFSASSHPRNGDAVREDAPTLGAGQLTPAISPSPLQ